jgi:hypothetical protein
VSGEPRVLNFRVFGIELERVADVLPAWAVPQDGFQPLEHHAGSMFRWVGGTARIAIHGAHGPSLALDVEPGPGVGSGPFELHAQTDAGATIASFAIAGRTTLRIPLDELGASFVLVLRTPDGGRTVASDPRVLDYRVFASSTSR